MLSCRKERSERGVNSSIDILGQCILNDGKWERRKKMRRKKVGRKWLHRNQTRRKKMRREQVRTEYSSVLKMIR